MIQYKGIVFGEVVSGVDFAKDFAANYYYLISRILSTAHNGKFNSQSSCL
ncbi:MAG TPA: hypothetical protein DC024_12290 [Clostridiales bacterium]|nr:hypothetical protein [Clostridiales bacterium]